MKEKHIIEILDNASLATLSESELNEVRTHAQECVSCGRAYEAARLSVVVLKSRAQTVVEPSPFFQTRVMAALREQQATESVPAMFRLWNSAKVLVSSMALATVALGVVSFIQPAAVPASDQTVSVYSAESVIMGNQSADDQMSYEQVLSTIYEDDDEAR